jgi:hypothetical protein
VPQLPEAAVEATMLLADFVQVSDNKLTAVGAGWDVTQGGEFAVPAGIGIIFWVPWDRTNEPHRFTLRLLTEDGEQVVFGPEEGGEALIIEDVFEVGRPPGVRKGTALSLPLAINIGPLPLPFDSGFVWRLEVPSAGLTAERAFRTDTGPARR